MHQPIAAEDNTVNTVWYMLSSNPLIRYDIVDVNILNSNI